MAARKCDMHDDMKEDVNKIEAKIEILSTEVTVMKTQMQDIPKMISLSSTILGILGALGCAVLFFFGKH